MNDNEPISLGNVDDNTTNVDMNLNVQEPIVAPVETVVSDTSAQPAVVAPVESLVSDTSAQPAVVAPVEPVVETLELSNEELLQDASNNTQQTTDSISNEVLDNPKDKKNKNEKKKKSPIILILIIIILLGLGAAFYFFVMPNIGKPVDKLFNDISNKINYYSEILGVHKSSRKINFKFNSNVDDYKFLNDYTFNVNISDNANDKTRVDISIDDVSGSKIKANILAEVSNDYVSIFADTNLFDKVIRFESDAVSLSNTLSNDDFNYLNNFVKNAVINSFNNATSNTVKGTAITVNGSNINVNVLKYIINSNVNQLIENAIISDSKVLQILANVSESSIDDIKNYFEVSDLITGDPVIEIYTNGLLNKYIGFSIQSNQEKVFELYNIDGSEMVIFDGISVVKKGNIITITDTDLEIEPIILNINSNGFTSNGKIDEDVSYNMSFESSNVNFETFDTSNFVYFDYLDYIEEKIILTNLYKEFKDTPISDLFVLLGVDYDEYGILSTKMAFASYRALNDNNKYTCYSTDYLVNKGYLNKDDLNGMSGSIRITKEGENNSYKIWLSNGNDAIVESDYTTILDGDYTLSTTVDGMNTCGPSKYDVVNYCTENSCSKDAVISTGTN